MAGTGPIAGAIFTLLFVSACDSHSVTAKVRADECDPAMRDWILQCIEKANPHSDEEPEDNTAQCENTATRLFCGPSCYVSLYGTVVCHISD